MSELNSEFPQVQTSQKMTLSNLLALLGVVEAREEGQSSLYSVQGEVAATLPQPWRRYSEPEAPRPGVKGLAERLAAA